MKKIAKILPIMVAVIMILSVFSTVFAGGNSVNAPKPSDITIEGTDEFNTIGGKIIGMVQSIGTIIAILVLVILGIKYMMGSAEEKAEYKKTMIPYLIGAVLIFAASNIAGAIYSVANKI